MFPSVSVLRRTGLRRPRKTAFGSIMRVLSAYLASSACSLQAPTEGEVFASRGGASTQHTSGGEQGSAGRGSNSGGQGSGSPTAGALSGGTPSVSDGGASPMALGGATGASGGSTSAGASAGQAGSGGGTPDIERGLVAHYAFEEATGDVVADTQDAARSGKCLGACLHLSGVIGGAIGLRNSDENVNWVELPSGVLSGMTATTVSLWVRDLSASRKDSPAFHFSRGMNEVFYFVPDDVVPETSSSGCSLGVKHDGTQIVSIRGNQSLTDRNWHHVAVTWTAAAVSLVVDGLRVGSQASPGALPDQLGITSPNYLGRALSETIPAINADLDELRIYDRALDSDEIDMLYKLR